MGRLNNSIFEKIKCQRAINKINVELENVKLVCSRTWGEPDLNYLRKLTENKVRVELEDLLKNLKLFRISFRQFQTSN
jgi:hypothetical protein